MQDTILNVSDLFENQELPMKPPKPQTVSAVSEQIKNLLDSRIGSVDVIGQLNSPNFGRHWYFSLTDGDAKIDCAMWASQVSSNKRKQGDWTPKQGDKVVVRGRVGHYPKFGKTQIYVEQMKPAKDPRGELQLQFEALVKELTEKGWLDSEHKKVLPEYPRTIAVVTSSTSAALQDVLETARQRMPSVKLIVVHAVMQGDGSPASVSEAIEAVDRNATSLGIDAIIVTRGGGGLEELWSFNDRRVVEAAFNCTTPIVVAIGHESDTTIIELVADHRASTPTQAVMALVPDREELLQIVEHLQVRLHTTCLGRVENLNTIVDHLCSNVQLAVSTTLHGLMRNLSENIQSLAAKRPHAVLQTRQKVLLDLQASLGSKVAQSMAVRTQRIEGLHARLDSIGPQQVLKRGYSLTQNAEGNVIHCASDVQEGDKIRTVLADGSIESEVKCLYE